LGFGLIKNIIIFYLLFILPSIIIAIDDLNLKSSKKEINYSYFKYWNPYKKVLDNKGDEASFFGSVYYKVSYNKNNRIKTVTRIGEDKIEKETYYFIWSKSGLRSEYKVKFHQKGNASQLDKFLYADQLSLVRKNWIADVKSRYDGRPKEVSFSDHLGFTYFYYNFNYTRFKDDNMSAEVVESSYFNSNGDFVGRHLIFWEDGIDLRMIQYFNQKNEIFHTKEFIHSRSNQETVRVIIDGEGKEIERKIIPYMPIDKYAYNLEWTGKRIIDHELKNLSALELALEFADRANRLLEEANNEVLKTKEALKEADRIAKNAKKALKKAEGLAKDTDSFEKEMDKARVNAQKAIERMYDAERDAEEARLEAAKAKASLDAVRKAKEIEDFAKSEAKKDKKEARRQRKEARALAREAKRTVQDSLFNPEETKTYLTFSLGQPFFVESSLDSHLVKMHYTFGLGRRNIFRINDKNINLSLDINWYDFKSDSIEQNFRTFSYLLVAQIDPRLAWFWIPNNMESGIRIGGGLVSPGYGFIAGYNIVYHLLPTPMTIGITSQFNWVSTTLEEETQTYWTYIGLMVGFSFEDKLPSFLDIEIPSIF
tara:strand:- start:401 stop:2188 length:1788 start_codon:yes stop_codon:yes gene_type:complete